MGNEPPEMNPYLYHLTSKTKRFEILENGLKTDKNRMLDTGEKADFVLEAEKILEEERPKNYPKRDSVIFLRIGVAERQKEKSVAVDMREIDNRVTYVAIENTVTDVREAINSRNDYEDARAIAKEYWKEMRKFNTPIRAKKYAVMHDILDAEFILVSDIPEEAINRI